MATVATTEPPAAPAGRRRLFGLLGVAAFVLLELAWVAFLVRAALLLA